MPERKPAREEILTTWDRVLRRERLPRYAVAVPAPRSGITGRSGFQFFHARDRTLQNADTRFVVI